MLQKPESPKVNIDHIVGLRRCFILGFHILFGNDEFASTCRSYFS